jgi:predicted component of type VI protein secretion system
MGFVLIEERPSAGTRHVIGAGTTIGREDCEITLSDDEVSRRHARIRALDENLAIEDLGSTNGTFVNGQKLTALVELHDGDTITMGNSELRVEAQRDEGATSISPVQGDAAPAPPVEPVQPAAATPPPTEPLSPAETPAPAPPAEPVRPAAATPPPEPAAPAPPTEQMRPAAPAPPAEPVRPAAATPTPEPARPAAPAQPATTVGPAADGSRGDVPAPPAAGASRVHRTFTPAAAPPQGSFTPEQAGSGRRKGSAATKLEATVACYGVILTTAAAVAVYLAQR